MEAARLQAVPGAPEEKRALLGELLVRAGRLTPDRLAEVLAEQAARGRRLGELLVERGWVAPRVLAEALAEQHGLEFLDLTQVQVEPPAVGLLPEKFALRYQALPVRVLDESHVLVAVSDPTDVRALDDLRLALGRNARLAVCEPTLLASAIARVYGVSAEGPAAAPERNWADGPDRQESAGGASAVELIDSVIARAVAERASDIHFDPLADQLVVRARIDGVLRRLTSIPKTLEPSVTSRLKVMGGLDIAEKRMPQDGGLTVQLGGQPTDVRIAVLPAKHGEHVVLRILHRATRLDLPALGMSPHAEQAFLRAIRQPYGAVIACGPTGSGKTTTLYAALGLLNEEGRAITTIEDPVEYQLPGVNQIEVHAKIGLTFARGLRTILRSDPDVLLVGEVRDEETAKIAVQAALTGHLVLTTLHTNDAAGAVARLKDMEVEPSLLASSVNCIVAQRLARRLCLDCREAYRPDPTELGGLAAGDAALYRPRGCARCSGTGYRGRVAVYEVLPVAGRVRALLESTTEEIFAAAVEQGMVPMLQDGLRLCLAGITSLEEVRRVIGDRGA